jgi:hypothetical protein
MGIADWTDAVAKWRAGGGKGKIPSRGTPDHAKILKMMGKAPSKSAETPKAAKAAPPAAPKTKRHGGKKDTAFIEDMEAKFFTKIDATVGPKGGVSKTPAKVKKAQEVSEEAAQAGFGKFKVRKVRSDKGSKRTKKE